MTIYSFILSLDLTQRREDAKELNLRRVHCHEEVVYTLQILTGRQILKQVLPGSDSTEIEPR